MNFNATLAALDINAHGDDVLDLAAAHKLEAWRPWMPAALLEGSASNPLACLQAVIVDPVREDSLHDDEFELITGLDARFMSSETSLDSLPPDDVLRAVGALTLCWLAAQRNVVRVEVLEPAGLSRPEDREDAGAAVDAWLAARAARHAAREVRSWVTVARAA